MKLKLVAVAIAALAPVFAIFAYNEVALRHQRSEEVRAQASQAARQAASEVERIIEGHQGVLAAVKAMPSLRNLDIAGCDEGLRSIAQNIVSVRMIFVLDLQGRPVCGNQMPAGGSTFVDRDYFRKAVDTRQTVVGTYTKSRFSGDAVLPIAAPLLEGDVVKAVVVTGVRLDWLQKRITERGIEAGNAVTIADGNGTILAREPFPERFVGTTIPEPFQSLIHSNDPGVVEVVSQDGTARVLGYRPIVLPASPLYVSAGFSKDQAFRSINRTTLMNTIAILGGAVFAFFVAIWIGNRFILRPISRIAGVMDKWRNGDASARTGMSGEDELAAVGATLDRLLDELECRRRSDEQAVEERALLVRELAHRVKNGFALVQAIARQTFSKVDAQRYTSFSERLAALAASYDLLLTKEAKDAPIKDVVAAALRAHLSADNERVSVEGEDVFLAADLALPLSLVVNELATNATKYGSLSSDTGTVAISWRRNGNRLCLCWKEEAGPAVAPPERKGFGSVLIERAFPPNAEARSRADYRPAGLVFELDFLV